jgi:WS/DGAT/MGAT family acyltransferase
LPVDRLTPLDASFLEAETPSAHMHVGWVARFSAPADGAGIPGFAELRAHVAARLDRAPRYRQRIEEVPLGVNQPVWVDDEEFELDHHFRRAVGGDLDAIADAVFSKPLQRDRPLWEIWVADRLDNGELGLVGKLHHCMVDGLAAVELGAMLLDLEPARGPLGRARRFDRVPVPEQADLFASGVVDRLSEQALAAGAALRVAATPWRIPGAGLRFARTLARAALPVAPSSPLNRGGSAKRLLAGVARPLDDLRRVRQAFDVTVNDVLLAAVAGGLRSFFDERGDPPAPLKAMVPVSVRADGEALGNRISFMFVELPCQHDDPLVRLMQVHRDTAQRKREGDPDAADAALQSIGYAPRMLQRAMTGLVASPRMFNLVVSNIPGPRVPLYMRGCRLETAWPVVPLAESHALSVGMTTVRDQACFGLYADASVLPDVDRLALHLDSAIDDLLIAAAEFS